MKSLQKEHYRSKSIETCIEHGTLSAPHPCQVQEHFRHLVKQINLEEIALYLITNM